ncbi:MAG: tRNA (N(6)-L-threonylcarbamoyladenosine(37)-C(2))-methylthiotransferase MtaB, partial [Candidatus Kryptonium sp.]
LPDKVPIDERHRRSEELRNLGMKKKYNFYRQMIGKTFDVLWEAEVKNNEMFGFTRNYVKVKTKYNPDLINQITFVKITGIESLIATCELTKTKTEVIYE